VPDEIVVTPNGVTVIGYTDLTARLPAQASQLYGTNVANLVQLLTPARDGRLVLDLDDVVVRAMTVVHDGETLWPPPPVAVSATPPAPAARPEPPPQSPVRTPLSPRRRLALVAVGALALFGVAAARPRPSSATCRSSPSPWSSASTSSGTCTTRSTPRSCR
jgi:NAD(P) transhydrogenase subunit alpha